MANQVKSYMNYVEKFPICASLFFGGASFYLTITILYWMGMAPSFQALHSSIDTTYISLPQFMTTH